MKQCYLCGSSESSKRSGVVRDEPSLEILECSGCGLVFLSSFDHIKENFYEDSGMHATNVEVVNWLKETDYDDQRRFNFLNRALTNKTVLDFGCGVGGFLIKANAVAKSVAGVEPERRLQDWFKQNNVAVAQKLENITEKFDVITAFHVVEHLMNPRQTLIDLSKKINSDGEIVVEVPSSTDALLSVYGNEAFSKFTYWACHIFLFNEHTLRLLAKQAGLQVKYIKQVQRYPLSNHLYWLAHGKPGGHKNWAFLDSDNLNNAYEDSLSSIGACDTLIASFTLE